MNDNDAALGAGAFGPEPLHDPKLGQLLQSVVGRVPAERVDWSRLASRIAGALEKHSAAPWWSYAARWERRAIPLALAAGIAGALTLWSTTLSARPLLQSENPEFMSALVTGVPPTDAVRSFARSVTGTADLDIESPQ